MNLLAEQISAAINAFIAAAYSSIDARDLLPASARSTLRPVVTQERTVQRTKTEEPRSALAGEAVLPERRGDPLVATAADVPQPPFPDEDERLRRHERDMRLAFRGPMA